MAKARTLDRAKLAELIPGVIEDLARTRPYGFHTVLTGRDSVKVSLPVPGSSFPVEVHGYLKYADQWTVEVSSGSWKMDGSSNLSTTELLRLYSQTLQVAAAIAVVLESAAA